MMTGVHGYILPLMMEDWLHVQRSHRKALPQWSSDHRQECCSNPTNCAFSTRYCRDRARDQDVAGADIKSTIFCDELAAIHCYLFHNITRTPARAAQNLDDDSTDEEDSDGVNTPLLHHSPTPNRERVSFSGELKYEDEAEVGLWSNQPQCVEQCDADQVRWLLEFRMFDVDLLKHNAFTKISQHKNRILNFFDEHKLDGQRLRAMGKKEFSKQINERIGDSKTMGPAARLFGCLIKYDLSEFVQRDEDCD